ncbi:MAG: class I SAM-dependent methyltransferase [Lachnospiraceae bacterium]|nr:class I SAM-dependent methyltransferase [Lachnospiraceae bacterium]
MNDSLLVNSHISDYLSSLQPDLPEFLENLYRKARTDRVPVIRREAQSFLRFVCLDRQPLKVLEIGTAIGFSSCLTAEFLPSGASILTVEKDDARFTEACENTALYAADYEKRRGTGCPEINCVQDDAEAFLKGLTENGECFDLIFLDAAKAQYPIYLELIRKLMGPESVLIADNVLQEGSLAESKFTVTRRDRTIHLRMREFIEMLFRSGEYDSLMLPLGDGITVSKLKKV